MGNKLRDLFDKHTRRYKEILDIQKEVKKISSMLEEKKKILVELNEGLNLSGLKLIDSETALKHLKTGVLDSTNGTTILLIYNQNKNCVDINTTINVYDITTVKSKTPEKPTTLNLSIPQIGVSNDKKTTDKHH